MINNLLQEKPDDRFPFVCLNPRFSWAPGFEYWENKFYSIIKNESLKRNISYQDGLSIIEKSISVLQLVPYYGNEFNNRVVNNNLKSIALIKNFVQKILIPKALNGQTLIIVARGERFWKLSKYRKKNSNIIIYEGPQTRSASLSPNSAGGKAIMEWLEKIP